MDSVSKSLKRYLRAAWAHCPFCFSPDISGKSFDMEATYVTQELHCIACEKVWTDVYELAGAIYDGEEVYLDDREIE